MTGQPLEGKVAIVTGAGRPRGIGRGAAIRLADQGASVVVTDLAHPGAEGEGLGDDFNELEQSAELCRELGVEALALPLDVTDKEAIAGCVEKTVEAFGRIDVLFNNAGTPVGVGAFEELTDFQWDLSWRVNVMGMVNLTKAVAPHMREAGGGSIINNASLSGLGAIKDFAAYTTTKFAVVGLTKSAAMDFAADGIRVNAVCPGYIDTLMGQAEIDLLAEEWEVTADEARDRMATDVPLGRFASNEEVGEVVAYLAGPAAAYITGVAIPVAGGLAPGL